MELFILAVLWIQAMLETFDVKFVLECNLKRRMREKELNKCDLQ